MQYRREIDGLRAFAVLPVILFHAGFEIFGGGFVGVDIFFVISGYLITSILIEDLAQWRFSILTFYERRARRILPALFFVSLCTIPFAWAWMLPGQFAAFAKSLIATSLFASNILFWKESGYFAAAAEEKPLLHTWSLAVEEQYYVLFPVFLLLAWRFGRTYVFWAIVALSAVSLAIAEWGWRNEPSASFYLIPTRAWELFAGSIAAFIVQRRGVQTNELLAGAGLLAILCAIFFYDRHTPFPSVYALLPVGGTVLLIVFASAQTRVARVLGWRGFVGLGLISYSAYLWHQPLFAFARIYLLDHPSAALMLALSVIAIALAYLSWRFVEQPFRGSQPIFKGRGPIFLFSGVGLAAFIGFGLFAVQMQGFPQRLAPEVLEIARYQKDDNPFSGRCQFQRGRLSHPVTGCTEFLEEGRAEVVFVGDSHSDAISYQAQLALQQQGISSYAVAYSGCPAVPGFRRADLSSAHLCDAYNKDMHAAAEALGAKTLVITSRFVATLAGTGFDNGEGGVEDEGDVTSDLRRIGPEGAVSALDGAGLRAAIQEELQGLSKRFNLVVVHPIPEVGWDVPLYMAKCKARGIEDCAVSTSLARYQERSQVAAGLFEGLDRTKVSHVRPQDMLCSQEGAARCMASRDGVPLYFDDDHLANSTGAALLAPYISDAVATLRQTP